MRNKGLVSVVVPFLDEERFIEEAIQSVLAQTYENWELLLVDDGSADKSTDIALRYARECPAKVRYLEHEGHQNRGVSVSRNLGIERARGEYIALLDADDVWLPHKLARQVAILEAEPEAGMVYGAAQWWYSWTGRPEDVQHDWVEEHAVPPNAVVEPPNLVTLFLQRTAVPCPCTVLVRREVVERVGGFEEGFGGRRLPQEVGEDQVFFVKIALKAPVFVAEECWAKYRLHPGSRMAAMQRVGGHQRARRTFLEWVEVYLTEQGYDRSQGSGACEVWSTLEDELRPYHHPVWHRVRTGARQVAERIEWFLVAVWLTMAKLARSALGRSTGSIAAQPNPVQVYDWCEKVGATTLSWTVTGTETAEVHVDAPGGPLFSRSGRSGTATTGKWVRDGMVFYLQDVSGRKARTLANTLAAVRVRVTKDEGASRRAET